MQVGAEDRKKLIAAVALMVLAVLFLARWLFSSGGSSTSATAAPPPTVTPQPAPRRVVRTARNAKTARTVPEGNSLDPTLRFDWLRNSEATEYKGTGRNIFRAEVDIPKPIHRIVKNTPPPPPPVYTPPPPPPIDIKFIGFSSKPGEPKRVFLTQGEEVFVAKEGDIVRSRYKILRISPNSIEVEDVLNNNRQEIPLTQS